MFSTIWINVDGKTVNVFASEKGGGVGRLLFSQKAEIKGPCKIFLEGDPWLLVMDILVWGTEPNDR